MLLKHQSKQSFHLWWTETNINGAAQHFQQKLKSVKSHLKCWKGDVFGEISQKKYDLLNQIADLDSKESKHALSEEEIQSCNKIKGELQDIICWRQKSRLQWLKYWRQQHSFLPHCCKKKKVKKLNSSLNIDGAIEDMTQIEKVLVTKFESFYAKQPKKLAWFQKWEGKSLTAQKSEILEKEFTLDE